MTKVSTVSGEAMRTMSRLRRVSSLLLLSGSLAAQTPGPRILVREAPVAKRSEKESQAVDLLASRISDYLQELIPCSRPSTMQDVRDLLGEARTRELLGSDDTAEMKQVLEQVDVRDLVSVNATEIGDQMVLNVFYMDMRTARAVRGIPLPWPETKPPSTHSRRSSWRA
jgi:hypothetical protein